MFANDPEENDEMGIYRFEVRQITRANSETIPPVGATGSKARFARYGPEPDD